MTKTEIEVVTTLTKNLPLLTADQVARCDWREAVKRLCRMGLLREHTFVFAPLIPGLNPLGIHRPLGPFAYADARRLARMAETRSRLATPQRHTVYQAASKAFTIWGDAARKHGNPFSMGHDSLLAEVFLRLTRSERTQWRYEPVPIRGPAQFEKVPDAGIVDSAGEVVRYHEAVGHYPVERFMLLAEHVDRTLANRTRSPNSGIYFW